MAAADVVKPPDTSGKLITGTSGWTDQSLAQCGRFYPASFKSASAAEKLKFYSSAKGNFGTVEVNTTNYSIPNLDAVAAWADATPEGFTIHVKLQGLLANGLCKVSMLPAEIRAKMPGFRGNSTVHSMQIPPKLVNQLWASFNSVCATLLARGKMGLVVVQLYDDEEPNEGTFRHLCGMRRRLFHSVRMAVELRNRSWYNTERAGTLVPVFRAIEDGDETAEQMKELEAKCNQNTEGELVLPPGQAESFGMADTSFAKRCLLNMPLARRMVHRPWAEGHAQLSSLERPRTPAQLRNLAEHINRYIKDGQFVSPEAANPPKTPPHPDCNQAAMIALFMTLGIVHVASDDLLHELLPKVATSAPVRMPVYPLVTSPAATYVRIHRRKGTHRLLSPQEVEAWAGRCRVMQQLQARLAGLVSYPMFSMEATWGNEAEHYEQEQEHMRQIMDMLCRVKLPSHPNHEGGIQIPEHVSVAAPCPLYIPAQQPQLVDSDVRLYSNPGAQFVLWGTDHEDQPVLNAAALRAALGGSPVVFDWATWAEEHPADTGDGSQRLTAFYGGGRRKRSSASSAQAAQDSDVSDEEDVVAVEVGGSGPAVHPPPPTRASAKGKGRAAPNKAPAAKAAKRPRSASPVAAKAPVRMPVASPTAAGSPAKRAAPNAAAAGGGQRQSSLTSFFSKR